MQTMLQSGATKLSCVTNLAKHLKDQQPGLNEEFREVRKAPISTSLKYYLSHLKGIVVTDVIVCLIFIFEFFFFLCLSSFSHFSTSDVKDGIKYLFFSCVSVSS